MPIPIPPKMRIVKKAASFKCKTRALLCCGSSVASVASHVHSAGTRIGVEIRRTRSDEESRHFFHGTRWRLSEFKSDIYMRFLLIVIFWSKNEDTVTY